METETLPAATALSQDVERLRSDLENVQRELDQALGVWRQALVEEKLEFQRRLQARQQDWETRESDWLTQRQALEQRIRELETQFESRAGSLQQNALLALNDLDDSWQRDKLQWDHGHRKRILELEQQAQAWEQERRREQTRLAEEQSERWERAAAERRELVRLLADQLESEIAALESCVYPPRPAESSDAH